MNNNNNKRDVYISLDGAKLCQKPSVDVVVYGYSFECRLEFFFGYLWTRGIFNWRIKKIGNDVVKTMHHCNCSVRAFVTKGLPAQKNCYRTIKN